MPGFVPGSAGPGHIKGFSGAPRGQALVNNSLTLNPGTYTITGFSTTLPVAHAPTLSPGTYTITGAATTLPVAHKPTLSPGAYTITGAATTLPVAHKPTLSPGTYTITGSPVTPRVARRLNLGLGSYTISGAAVTFIAPAVVVTTPLPPYLDSADRNGFTPFPGGGQIPGASWGSYPGPTSQWRPYDDIAFIAYDYAMQLFLGTRDRSCLQALAAIGIGSKV